tara:strand:- start:1294 stop:2382 length:1089 start_codon:yes stop_codon:yes gene_type:complete
MDLNLRKGIELGTIRLLLAFAVVFSHSYGHLLVGGRLAVQMFYIISGFLISFIIVELKSYSSIKKFYLNRILRLFPAYYFISIITLFFYLYLNLNENVVFFDTFKQINVPGKIYLIISNIFILGQDLAFFMGIKDGTIEFLSNYTDSEIIIYEGHISHISWTLSLEMMFYLIAPFILKNKKLIICILLLSILLRILLIYNGIGLRGGFNYRFFPLELALFLLGALSHQVMKPYFEKVFDKNFDILSKYITYLIITYVITFSFIPGIIVNTFIMIVLLICGLPFIFHFQNISKWDKWIGRFSYPIYVCHWLAISVAEHVFPNYGSSKLYFILITTILLSLITEYFINVPFESSRNKNKRFIHS